MLYKEGQIGDKIATYKKRKEHHNVDMDIDQIDIVKQKDEEIRV